MGVCWSWVGIGNIGGRGAVESFGDETLNIRAYEPVDHGDVDQDRI